jgi:hypothetical protein
VFSWQGTMPRTASGKLDRPAIIATAKADAAAINPTGPMLNERHV